MNPEKLTNTVAFPYLGQEVTWFVTKQQHAANIGDIVDADPFTYRISRIVRREYGYNYFYAEIVAIKCGEILPFDALETAP